MRGCFSGDKRKQKGRKMISDKTCIHYQEKIVVGTLKTSCSALTVKKCDWKKHNKKCPFYKHKEVAKDE